MASGCFQASTQTSQEQSQISTLRPVKRMQLVNHQVAQCGRRVALPQPAILGPEQQIVQHLVVGQQNIWRILSQCVAVCDDTCWRHHHALARIGNRATHKQAYPQASKGWRCSNKLCKPTRLVGRQRVHGVDYQRLDARLTGFAGTCAVV